MFTFEDDKSYRMPAHFGGHRYEPTETCYHDTLHMSYTCRTDGDCLCQYIPEGFELVRPELAVTFCQCRAIDWMAGSAYNLIDVSAPVRFNGRRDRLEGSFSLVVWENRTAPILGGREETGIPKIYADIEDLHVFQDRRFTTVSFEGNTFLQMEMTVAAPLDDSSLAGLRRVEMNTFGWRYIPKVGGPGADLSQPILYPQRMEVKGAWQGDGSLQWAVPPYERNPGQAHIIRALAELPVLDLSPVIMMEGALFMMPSMARVLE